MVVPLAFTRAVEMAQQVLQAGHLDVHDGRVLASHAADPGLLVVLRGLSEDLVEIVLEACQCVIISSVRFQHTVSSGISCLMNGDLGSSLGAGALPFESMMTR